MRCGCAKRNKRPRYPLPRCYTRFRCERSISSSAMLSLSALNFIERDAVAVSTQLRRARCCRGQRSISSSAMLSRSALNSIERKAFAVSAQLRRARCCRGQRSTSSSATPHPPLSRSPFPHWGRLCYILYTIGGRLARCFL